jgi:hypothetical protein
VVRLLWLLIRLVIMSRRSIAALVGYVAVLGVLYAQPGPLPEAYVPTSAALVVITAWLVVAGVSGVTADRSTAHLLTAAARGALRLHVLITASGVVSALPLVAVSLVGGRLLAGPPAQATVLVAGLVAHLVAALVGAGLGAIAARPVVGEPALAPAIVVGGFVLVIVITASSPVGPALHLLQSTGSASPPGLWDIVVRGCVWCALALGWAAVLTVVGGLVAGRRRSYGTNAAT